jgi:hypothetical protein
MAQRRVIILQSTTKEEMRRVILLQSTTKKYSITKTEVYVQIQNHVKIETHWSATVIGGRSLLIRPSN